MDNMNVLEYKGYHTKVECSIEDGVLYGKIEGIKDLVTFECERIIEAESAFHEAVDDYLAYCEEVGKEPDKTYSGVFNVRISPELHRQAALAADRRGVKLNTYVREAIEHEVGETRNGKQVYNQYQIYLGNYEMAGMTTEKRQEGIRYASRS